MKKNKKAAPKARSLNVLAMLLTCKAGVMKDRRQERGGSKNKQVSYLSGSY